MNKKKIDKLVAASYKDDQLDKKKVYKIASLINRTDLKKYINGLKMVEKKKTLIISSPTIDTNIKNLKKLFPNKKIVFKKDSSLMLGVRVASNDIVYEYTLKDSFDKIVNYIEQNYD